MPEISMKAVVTSVCYITLGNLPVNMAGQVPFHLESVIYS
jgi:hypothetical protein